MGASPDEPRRQGGEPLPASVVNCGQPIECSTSSPGATTRTSRDTAASLSLPALSGPTHGCSVSGTARPRPLVGGRQRSRTLRVVKAIVVRLAHRFRQSGSGELLSRPCLEWAPETPCVRCTDQLWRLHSSTPPLAMSSTPVSAATARAAMSSPAVPPKPASTPPRGMIPRAATMRSIRPALSGRAVVRETHHIKLAIRVLGEAEQPVPELVVLVTDDPQLARRALGGAHEQLAPSWSPKTYWPRRAGSAAPR
jgi:hypothetical protein